MVLRCARRVAVALDLLAKLRREVEKERERKRRVMRERSRPIPPAGTRQNPRTSRNLVSCQYGPKKAADLI